MLILAAVLSILMGITLGLLGGGGSILTVPILRYALDVPAKATIAASLLIVGTTAAIGLLPHARRGNVAWRTGFIFAAFAMAGAYAGGQLAQFIAGPVLLLMFGGLMLVTGFAMLHKSKHRAQDEPLIEADELLDAGPGGTPLEAKAKEPRAWWVIGLEGLVVGLVTGMVGAGGGFLVVPALVLLGGLSMVEAVGTSLLVIAMKSFAGFAGYAAHVEIDWALTGIVTVAAATGTVGGAWLAQRIEPAKLRQGFAYFVFVMAGVIIYQEGVAQYGDWLVGISWHAWALTALVGALAAGLMVWFWRTVVSGHSTT